MQNPTVSFVIPCYKLAHLLPECVNSILSQTYHYLEVLIMDDCSPDNTPEVARSLQDPRVKHIRNNPNLGHLRNYNKGISLSRGKYVWLISADDYLRRPYILQRYVEVLEKNPDVGYAFCPAVTVKNDQECGVEQYSVFRNRDCIVRGHTVLRKLLEYNIVPAASGMVRRELYEKVGLFPLNMTWIGDWYLWSAFALYADVAFFSEPMVCYRKHEASMESSLVGEANNRDCLAQVLEMFWTLKVKADEAGFRSVSKKYLRRFTEAYGRHLFSNLLNMSLEEFEDVLSAKTQSQKERKWIRARAYAVIGDQKYHRGERALAMKFYQAALQADPLMAKVLAKSFLLSLGKPGDFARKVFRSKGTV